MSQPEPTAEPVAQPKKRHPLLTTVILAGCVILIIGGLMKFTRGMQTIFGASLDPEVQQLLTESDAAFERGRQGFTDADAALQKLATEFDAAELATFRQDKAAASQQLQKSFEQASREFDAAATKLDAAMKHKLDAKLISFLTPKAAAHRLFAKAASDNAEGIQVMLDESITDKNAAVEKIVEIANRRDAALTEAGALNEQADAIVKAAK